VSAIHFAAPELSVVSLELQFKNHIFSFNGKICPPITNKPGTYVLLIYLTVKRILRVGSLEEITFSPEYYAYVGSAMSGLRGRTNRYLKTPPKVHWHIDYLLQIGQLKEIFTLESRQRKECIISGLLAQSLLPAANRFGATDCACFTHLYFAPEKTQIKRILKTKLKVIPAAYGHSAPPGPGSDY
jgi:Uri superfamily endonuclease